MEDLLRDLSRIVLVDRPVGDVLTEVVQPRTVGSSARRRSASRLAGYGPGADGCVGGRCVWDGLASGWVENAARPRTSAGAGRSLPAAGDSPSSSR
jgi:hypothetical protein